MFKEEKVLGKEEDAKERVRELLVRYKYKTERRSKTIGMFLDGRRGSAGLGSRRNRSASL